MKVAYDSIKNKLRASLLYNGRRLVKVYVDKILNFKPNHLQNVLFCRMNSFNPDAFQVKVLCFTG